MPSSPNFIGLSNQLVGDPVDTFSGAVLEQKFEFRLTGPLELWWYRHYDSSQNQRQFALGWGHTHSFDHALSLQNGEIHYAAPVGQTFSFPLLQEDGDSVGLHGFLLRRKTSALYTLARYNEPIMEFLFHHSQQPARLKCLIKGQHQIKLSYNSKNQLERIIDSIGRIISVVEDNNGKLHKLTINGSQGKPDKLLASYQYDEKGNLIATKNDQGHGYKFTYDESNRMLMQRGRKGFTFHYLYDNQGRCIRSMGNDRIQGVALNYKIPSRLTIVTRPDRGVWHYYFDKAGLLTKILDPLGGTEKFIYNELGQLALEMDSNDNATKVIYDKTGLAIAKIDPLGHRVSLPEDPNEPEPLAHRVAANPAEYEYGRLLNTNSIRLPDRKKTQDLNLPKRVQSLIVTPSSKQYLAHRDAQFNIPPLGVLWWPEPAHGRVFNELGKLVKQYDEFGRERRWTYDASGNLEQYFDFDGGNWLHNYPAWHLLQSLTNPLSHQVQFTYTPSEEVASCLDAGGTLSEYRYDQKDHLVEIKRHGVIRETYTRDANGNLIAKHAYDGRELLRLEIGAGNLPVRRLLASGEEHSFQYDPSGRYLTANTKKDPIDFAYDELGNCILEKRNGLGVEHTYQGWRKPEKTVLFDCFTVSYTRLHNTLSITDPTGQSHEIEFLGNGLTERRFSNKGKELSQHDSLGRCLFKSYQHPSSQEWSRQYHWSGEGDLLKVEDNKHGVVRHEYDAAHRLSRRLIDGQTEDYEMDVADNLIAQPGLKGVTLQGGNRLRTANGFRFTYNDRNHIASKRNDNIEIRYHYDSRDQLIRVEMPEGVWEADYDALGRRTRKIWRGEITEYHWNDDQLIAEIAHDGKLRLYVYPDPLALTPLLFIDYDSVESLTEQGKLYFVLSDQISTPCAIQDEKGVQVWTTGISPFGQAHADKKSNIGFNLRFPGHYFDDELGLHYNRFRYYDPLLGRYIQSDPWGLSGGFNLYSYQTNPLFGVDARGLGEENDPKCKKSEPDEEGIKKPSQSEESSSTWPPPRTEKARKEAQKVVDTMANMGLSNKKRKAIDVLTHEDGTVSVGISGNSNSKGNAEVAKRLETKLNENSPGKYRVATKSMPTDNDNIKPITNGNKPGNCAEPKSVNAANGHNSPITGNDTRWRGGEENPHPYTGSNSDGAAVEPSQMNPCPTCGDAGNSSKYEQHANE